MSGPNTSAVFGGRRTLLLSADGIKTQAHNAIDYDGEINLIKNGRFELTANGAVPSGWATYADAAGVSPVDGTGGSPNVTFLASTSSPLEGLVSAVLTKDAANRQGEGASFDFTLPAFLKSRAVGITFDFSASSPYTGSSGTEYAGVFIYDVTNATLITPTVSNIPQADGRMTIGFAATTSTSYRLILHVAGAGTSAWTLKIDNIYVGPKTEQLGPAIGDWQSYTPTITGASGSYSSAGRWRRIGDSLEVQFEAVNGTPSSGSVDVSVGIPSGMTIDTTKQTTTPFNNMAYISANALYALQTNGNTVGPLVTGTNNFLVSGSWPASSRFHGRFTVPIVGWSSNVTMAERAVEEYAADDGTSDVFGTSGALVPNVGSGTGTTNRDFTFQTAKQNTDNFIVELYFRGNGWAAAGDIFPFIGGHNSSSSNFVGIRGYWTTTTTYRVSFGNRGTEIFASNVDTGSNVWSTEYSNGTRFRVRKVSGGAVVGYPIGARNIIGDTSGTAVPAGYIGEVKETKVSSFQNATGTGQFWDVGSLLLPKGNWAIYASIQIYRNGATMTLFSAQAGISVVPGNSASGLLAYEGNYGFVDLAVTADSATPCCGPYTTTMSVDTTYYLKAYTGTYSAGTPQARGIIRAIRIA